MLARPERAVIVGPSDDGFLVEIIPPLEGAGNFDQWHPTYKKARGYAGGLRLSLALPLVDLCEGADGAR